MAEQETIIEINCSKCNRKYSELNKLTCTHQFCDQCISQCKKDDVAYVCCLATCGLKSDGKPELVKGETISGLVKRIETISYDYQRDLTRREEECAIQIDKLDDALVELKSDEKEQIEELEQSLEDRYKQLKEHYGALETRVRKNVSEREKQINNILQESKGILVQIKDEVKGMKSIFKKASDTFNTIKLDELKTKTEASKQKTVQVDIPKFKTNIIKAEGLSLEDSIQIVAPQPILFKKKDELAASKLLTLTEMQLNRVKGVKLKAPAQSLTLINGELYSCEGPGGIGVYTTEARLKRTIDAGTMMEIFGVAGLPDGTLVIAATTGLFHVDEKGSIKQKISKHFHTSVRFKDEMIYAAVCDVKLNAQCQIHTHQNRQDAWKKSKPYPLKCKFDHHITLTIGSDVMYVACIQDDVITVLSRSTGTVLKKIGNRSGVSPLCGPCTTEIDTDDSVLVCNSGNNSIEVLTKDEKRKSIPTNPAVEKPCGAVFVDGLLFLASGSEKNKLFMYKMETDPKQCAIQ